MSYSEATCMHLLCYSCRRIFSLYVKKIAVARDLLGPCRMSVQQASQEGPCEAVPTDGFTTVAEHSSCAARGLAYEARSEEHTSELQSRGHLVCRLLLEKKKPKYMNTHRIRT